MNWCALITALLLLGSSAMPQGPQTPGGSDFINRRDQARAAFLSSARGIYRHYCAHCHGETGHGDGRLWSSEMPSLPANLATLGKDEDYLVTAISEGSASHGKSNLCPAWGGTISANNVRRLARYVLSFGGRAAGASPRPAANAPAGAPFPWWVGLVLLLELTVFWQMFGRRRARPATN